MLKMPNKTGRKELSYAFRPLTKNGYVSKSGDGCVSILAKGRALYSDVTPLISSGGGERERKRVMQVSRMAMWMEEHGFPAEETPGEKIAFIPSARWRNIAPGILSTSRFVGMLVGCGRRLAVYDIGDGHMDWQIRAENSLFYTKYGSYETRATGMLLVCQEDKREEVAENIIRQTIGYSVQKEPFAREMAGGTNDGDEVILTIREPLPSIGAPTPFICAANGMS